MDDNRKIAMIVGILFIIATVFLFIGEAFYKPVLSSPDYLKIAYPNRTTVVAGMLLEFLIVLTIPLIPVFLFPVLKKKNEILALGYVVFRFFEAVLIVLIEINKLSLIDLSRAFLNRGALAVEYFQAAGSSIVAVNDWMFFIYVLVFGVGALMLNAVLYSSKLVPRFISGWGLLAAILILVGPVLIMLGVLSGMAEGTGDIIFALPIAVQEMVFALWLIIKGFDRTAQAG